MLTIVLLLFSATWSQNPVQVAILGDSLTAGNGVASHEAFPSVLQQKLRTLKFPVFIQNAGVSGDTTSDGLARLPAVLMKKPDVVVVALGANDMLRGWNPEVTEKNLRSIIQKIRAVKSTPVLLGMKATPNLGSRFVKKFDSIFPTLAKSEKAALYPFFLDRVAGSAQLNQPDGLHPTAAGHKIIAENVYEFLKTEVTKKHREFTPH